MNYSKIEILKKLDLYKDPKFKFNPKYHKYTYDGKQFESVTTFIQKFHRKFDKDYWSKKKAEEDGVTIEEKLREWQEKNDRANEIGTFTHEWIEDYFNGIYKELPADLEIIDRINKFNVIFAKKLYKLSPVKFEQRIFSVKWGLAGTIDSIFLYNGDVVMIDHKTNAEFTTHRSKNGKYEFLLPPFENFYKNHLSEYSIQLSLYSLILEEIGIDVKSMYLLYIGPNEPAKLYKAFNLKNELKIYFGLNDIFSL